MKRQIITDKIFWKEYRHPDADVHISDLPEGLLPTDIIDIDRDHEGFYSENNSWDPFARLVIYREREENDQELTKRLAKDTRLKDDLKVRRHDLYLKLQKEFENGEVYDDSDDGKPIVWSKYCRHCGHIIDDCDCLLK